MMRSHSEQVLSTCFIILLRLVKSPHKELLPLWVCSGEYWASLASLALESQAGAYCKVFLLAIFSENGLPWDLALPKDGHLVHSCLHWQAIYHFLGADGGLKVLALSLTGTKPGQIFLDCASQQRRL